MYKKNEGQALSLVHIFLKIEQIIGALGVVT